ncbi:aldo/keto reductase [Conexibacter sp. CPCC 206217]|uniref:aldo/keto reductase n=1 Tax=Conexibacter sp. CPCC 206217 TaxID=3064574 RepID=UPI00351C6970
MQYTQLGNSGTLVSRICLGAMTFGGAGSAGWETIGALGAADVDRLVGHALDAGVNFFDTADMYAAGESEQLLGRALGGRRDEVVLATKAHGRMGPGANDVGQSRVHLMRALEGSLRRLGTDTVDLYQVHSFDPLTPLEETLRTLDDMVRQGKVRYVGCSNYAAWQLARALGVSALHGLERYVSLQAHYSLVGRDLEHELLPLIEDERLGLLVWSPLSSGFLSGKYTRETSDAEGRFAQSEFLPIDRERGYDVIEALIPIAERHEVSAAQVALAWLLAKPAVTSVIVGARRLGQLTDNLGAVDVELSAEELETLDAAGRPGPFYPNWLQAQNAGQRRPG